MLKLTKQIATEFVSALSVLALVFLSFNSHASHAPINGAPNATTNAAYEINILSFCGDSGPSDHNGAHAPCHACRINLAALPAPPCDAEPAFKGFAHVQFSLTNDRTRLAYLGEVYRARAPPIVL